MATENYIKKHYRLLVLISIVVISLSMHYRHFSKELMGIHAWRQIQTQTTITNFYDEDMNILNPRKNARGDGDGIFRMEFPLMQWLVAALYKLFGNHLVITRIFMFVIGLFSVLGMYKLLGAIFRNDNTALIGAWAFNFSPSFYYYTINPLPDNFALCCSIWGTALFFSWIRNRKPVAILLGGLFMGIGALCKLPFILYFAVPAAYFALDIFRNGFSRKPVTGFLKCIVFLLLPLSWYAYVVPQWHGNGIVHGMLSNREPFIVILDYLQHNLISNLPELLLNYGSVLFFIAGFYYMIKNKASKNPLFIVLASWSLCILAYFLFEINMIAKTHDYYLFPFYPILFILVSYGATHMLNQNVKFLKHLTILLLLILPLTAWLRMHGRWDPDSPGFNNDLLMYKTELRNAVPANALCVTGNDESTYIFLYYADKKGWVFDRDNLSGKDLVQMINLGASHLYSDSRIIEEKPEIRMLLDKLVLEKGSVRVYSLKKL